MSNSKPKTFESSLEELERIVRELEQGELTLEKSLELFEQGVRLSRECQERLNQAERRIEILLRDSEGRLLTREELRNPATLTEATSMIPNYSKDYTYERVAHVRLARLPFEGFHLRWILDKALPDWEERIDWTLLLERESFFALCASAFGFAVFLLFRLLLGWYADTKLKVARFRLRSRVLRAGASFFSAPEIK